MAPWNATGACTILDHERAVQVLHDGRWVDGWVMAQRRDPDVWWAREFSARARSAGWSVPPRARPRSGSSPGSRPRRQGDVRGRGFGTYRWTDAKRRAECRPLVYRINFQPTWTMQRDQTTHELEPGSAACHDITYHQARLYCATPNATLILDTTNMFQADGDVKGTPFPCPVVDGTRTGAKVTDCSGMEASRPEAANGWQFLDTYQQPGRDCVVGADVRNCNSNNFERSDHGISIGHEADPTPDQQFMFVTDERGGGVVAPGSSCTPGIENPYGNGGAHAFDIGDPTNIHYATTPSGERSV